MLADEHLCTAINLYLQELGTLITAEKLHKFLSRPEIKAKHGITKEIMVQTAEKYLHKLDFHFTFAKKGQYTDGHERMDVVKYCDDIFIPLWERLEPCMRNWELDYTTECQNIVPGPQIVAWFHDETIFHANNRHWRMWYHKDAPAQPYAKGEGASFMVADYISTDYRFLQSLDQQKSA